MLELIRDLIKEIYNSYEINETISTKSKILLSEYIDLNNISVIDIASLYSLITLLKQYKLQIDLEVLLKELELKLSRIVSMNLINNINFEDNKQFNSKIDKLSGIYNCNNSVPVNGKLLEQQNLETPYVMDIYSYRNGMLSHIEQMTLDKYGNYEREFKYDVFDSINRDEEPIYNAFGSKIFNNLKK